MLPPKSLPARAFEVAHVYRKGKFFEASVRPVTITQLLPYDRCDGIDELDAGFRANLDVFYATRSEADDAAFSDMEKLLPDGAGQ